MYVGPRIISAVISERFYNTNRVPGSDWVCGCSHAAIIVVCLEVYVVAAGIYGLLCLLFSTFDTFVSLLSSASRKRHKTKSHSQIVYFIKL